MKIEKIKEYYSPKEEYPFVHEAIEIIERRNNPDEIEMLEDNPEILKEATSEYGKKLAWRTIAQAAYDKEITRELKEKNPVRYVGLINNVMGSVRMMIRMEDAGLE